MKHFVYIVKCVDKTYYIGYCIDLNKRIEKHNLGKGAKYTRGRRPVVLMYYETFTKKQDALQREYEIKQLTRKQKEKLIHTLYPYL